MHELTFDVPAGELVLSKDCTVVIPGAVAVGDLIAYAFEVTNTGSVTLSDVNVSDMAIGLLNQSVEPATLEPGDVGVLTSQYALTQLDLDRAADNGGVLVNDAVASGTDISGDLVGGEASHEFEIPEVGMITLEKSGEITSGEGNQVGDEITYTFTVNNTGTSDLLVVTIDDAVLDVNDLAVTPATILPGQSGTATYTHVLTQADICLLYTSPSPRD